MSSNIEKDIYSFDKNYDQVVFSKKRAPLDYELNELQKIQNGLSRAFVKSAISDNAVGDGFLVESTGNANEVRIRKGYLFASGILLNNASDLVINTLTTPIADRTDLVYLEFYEQPIDAGDDPAIVDQVNIQYETATRQKMMVEVLVSEGAPIPVPAVGRQQYLIAVLNRLNGVSIISAPQVEDRRSISGKNYVSSGGKVFSTGGFNFYFEGATGLAGGNFFSEGALNSSVGPNDQRFLYIAENLTLTNAASLPTSYHVPLAKIESDLTSITTITDLRRFSPLSSGGGGDATNIQNVTLIQDANAYEVGKLVGAYSAGLAQGNSLASMPSIGMFLDSGLTGDSVRILLSGVVSNVGWSLTPGAEVYVSSSVAGGITHTAPAAIGQVKQKVGIALSTTDLYFNPDLTYEVIGGATLHAQNTDLGTNSESFVTRYGVNTPIATPSGFYINPGSSNPLRGVRYDGAVMQVSHDGVNWQKIGSGGQHFREEFVGDGVTTVFNLSQPYTPGGNELLVFIGSGLVNSPSDYVETNSTTVTFVNPPLNGVAVVFLIGLGGGDTVIVSSHQPVKNTFTGDGVQTVFALSQTPITDSVMIFLDSVYQRAVTDFTLTGNQVTFASPPGLGVEINAHYDYYA